MKQPLAVILEQASSIKDHAQKIQFLRNNSSKPMMIVLQYALHPAVKWLLPEGAPPYTPIKNWDDQEAHLFLEARKLYLFIEGGYPGNLTQQRRETMFIEILEGVHAKDAELLCEVKEKRLPYAGLNADIIREAFPGLIP